MENSRNPYDKCPVLENESFLLRLVAPEDAEDLLPCYSHPTDSVTANSFNCFTGEGGYGTQTLDGMKEFIRFWLDAYANRQFVRWSVVDKRTRKTVGTIELFSHPSENTFFNNNGILRLDLSVDYEQTEAIDDILPLLLPDAFEIFGCAKMTTKVSPSAADRIAALQAHGFKPTDERFMRQDGVYFDGFWVLERAVFA
jgi:RimJ/RimL family protein N-acetyltransferase